MSLKAVAENLSLFSGVLLPPPLFILHSLLTASNVSGLISVISAQYATNCRLKAHCIIDEPRCAHCHFTPPSLPLSVPIFRLFLSALSPHDHFVNCLNRLTAFVSRYFPQQLASNPCSMVISANRICFS